MAVQLAGVRTNFRMPDMVSIPLGGGTIVERDPFRMGPESVGYRLTEKALVFGGSTVTATDLAVAEGRANVGDPNLVSSLDRPLVSRTVAEIQSRVEDAIDRVKLSYEDVPVILVGGGSILVGDSLTGSTRVLRPGACRGGQRHRRSIAQVGGQVERVYSLETHGREEAIADCSAAAIDRAVAAGADPETTDVVEIDEVPLTYVPSNATLVRVKAVGNLAVAG